jgi:HPt (histidine-containing phosphotransfer) domain-containing protein
MTTDDKKAEAKRKLSALMSELKEDYLGKLPDKIAYLKKLTIQQDWKALEHEYHKLKGTGKTYGLPEISSVCLKLEAMAQQTETRDHETFTRALTLIEKIHAAHQQGQSFDLQSDDFARRLLAPAPK